LSVSPQNLNFANNLQSLTLYVEAIGGDLGAAQITNNITWLSITPDQVNDSGYGSYSVSVDRNGLTEGTYSGEFRITAGSSSADVEVIMSVMGDSQSGGGGAGMHYVLLIDAATNSPVLQELVNTNTGDTSFSFSNVSAGSYYLVAGSDMDMDDLICDAGESCGAYSTLAQPVLIDVGSEGLNGLDFTASFDSQSPSESASTKDEKADEPVGYPRLH
jgi:serine protease